MAKGNLFQGMARGKVGDVVFSRLNGEQISRVRNRHPKNPRTNAQLYQRAIMATIQQAYSAGKEIFDHSFEGKAVGADNMRVFMSRNIRSLRGQVSADLLNNVALAASTARLVAPGSITPVPVPGLIASQGTLTQELFTINPAAGASTWNVALNGTHSAETNVEDWATEMNLRAGDIFTIVVFESNPQEVRFEVESAGNDYGVQYEARFGWARFIVKQELPTGTLSGKTFGDFFNISVDGEVFTTSVAALSLTQGTFDGQDLMGNDAAIGTMGIIRSRDDEGTRSTCIMVDLDPTQAYGIVPYYILEAWQQGSMKLGNSDLLLEGGKAGTNASGNATDESNQGGSTGSATPPGSSGD